ncbi:Omega-amidase, chloroplastic, variant 2 [Sarracenia purpurea var. burkii]
MASLSNSTVNVPFSADENREMPKILKFKIGLCQLSVTSDKNHNLARARNSIEVAAKKGASLVVLPEMWNCPYSTHYFAKYAEDFDDKNGSLSFSLLSEVAFAHSLTIVGGSMPERRNELLYNTCCVFGPDGNLKAKYSKMHMFDIHIPGDISFKESEVFTAGDQPTIVDTGAHLICYPGAFNMSTGELLWELEQRARAADNQLYIAACSPARDSIGSYKIWGHSTVVGPSGEIIASSRHEEAIVITEIDYSTIRKQRETLPLEKRRRGDVYMFVDVHEKKRVEE